MKDNGEHKCALPICTRCEIEGADEMERNQEWKRRLFAAHGHNADDPNDDWNQL